MGRNQPEMTGFDYMLAMADLRAKEGDAFAEEFKAMLWDYSPETPERSRSRGQEVVMQSLRPEEAIAVAVVAGAAGLAIERRDRRSLEEILFWGTGVAVKFAEWLKATGRKA